jgi:hypothetical protein
MWLPKLDAVAVAHFLAQPRVATGVEVGRTLTGRPRLGCLECETETVRLYDDAGAVVFEAPIDSIAVRKRVDKLILRVDGRRHVVRAADPSGIRRRGGPQRYLDVLDRHATTDRVPGLSRADDDAPGHPAETIRRGIWAGLWERLLRERGATAG